MKNIKGNEIEKEMLDDEIRFIRKFATRYHPDLSRYAIKELELRDLELQERLQKLQRGENE